MMRAGETARRAFWHLMKLALTAVFVYAGATKIAQPEYFVASIARFPMVPDAAIHPITLGLPVFEILCGLALVIGPWRRQAAFSLTLLCTVFLMALISADVLGIEVKCSCFGGSSAEVLSRSIGRDLVLLMVACAIYLKTARQPRSLRIAISRRTPALNATC
jgi:uncharacterized membrane protein YphA (DoxX/SURF4 family)